MTGKKFWFAIAGLVLIALASNASAWYYAPSYSYYPSYPTYYAYPTYYQPYYAPVVYPAYYYAPTYYVPSYPVYYYSPRSLFTFNFG